MSTVGTEAPEKSPPRDGRPQRPPGRFQRAWGRLSDGLEARQLWEQFRREARDSYELYRREIDWDARDKERGFRRAVRIFRQLFWAVLMKLSPSRRVFLVITMFVSILGAVSFAMGRYSFRFDVRGIGFFLLFVLLGLELADRVTMKRDLEIARDIQRWLAPERPPETPGIDIAFSTRPANTVGGDFYDAFYRDPERKRLLLAVADVAGKSVPAALLMATFQACLHSVSEDCEDVVKLAERLNHFACSRSLEGRRFTTAFLAELNLDTFSIEYVNAGHNAPVVQRADGRQERLERGGLPFGIDPAARYPSSSIRLERDDLLLIFTDGLVEAVNPAAAEYGDPRMLGTLAGLKGRSAAETIRGMVASVDAFAAGARQYDDITFLAARRL